MLSTDILLSLPSSLPPSPPQMAAGEKALIIQNKGTKKMEEELDVPLLLSLPPSLLRSSCWPSSTLPPSLPPSCSLPPLPSPPRRRTR